MEAARRAVSANNVSAGTTQCGTHVLQLHGLEHCLYGVVRNV
jgi:hypothetical protein